MDEEAAPQAAAGQDETFNKELDVLRFNWDTAYDIEPAGEPGTARARRRDGEGGWMECTPDEVTALIVADYRARPVSREVAP